MSRGPAPKFDHTAARLRHAQGASWAEISREQGVTVQAVRRVCLPHVAARMAARTTEMFRAICDDCGGECSHNWWSRHQRHDRVVCLRCHHERLREDELLKRLDTDGLIHCNNCDAYKDIAEYRMRSTGYPALHCRPCETALRQDHRRRNPETERARDRERRRRIRALAAE